MVEMKTRAETVDAMPMEQVLSVFLGDDKKAQGEHARIITDLWEMVKQRLPVDVKDGEIPSENRTTNFVLKKSYLFTADQVVPIAEEAEHGNHKLLTFGTDYLWTKFLH